MSRSCHKHAYCINSSSALTLSYFNIQQPHMTCMSLSRLNTSTMFPRLLQQSWAAKIRSLMKARDLHLFELLYLRSHVSVPFPLFTTTAIMSVAKFQPQIIFMLLTLTWYRTNISLSTLPVQSNKKTRLWTKNTGHHVVKLTTYCIPPLRCRRCCRR